MSGKSARPTDAPVPPSWGCGRLAGMWRIALPVLLLAVTAIAADDVMVNRQAPSVEHRKFDRNSPPADMPPLEPQEAAVTKAVFGIGTEISVQTLPDQRRGGKTVSRHKVTSVSLSLSLAITIWVPDDAPKTIIDHEEGHRQISEYFYKDAQKIARDIARKYVGQVYESDQTDKAINELSQKYMAETQNLSVRANVIFDEITQHSRNQKISVEKAVKDSIERAKKEKEKK